MRFAAIADVHGNYLALEAVLADIRAQGIAEIVNLGDMASSPLEARRTMDALMTLDAVHVLGNHDRCLIDRPLEKMGSWDRPAYAQLNAGHLDWLRKVPRGLSPYGLVIAMLAASMTILLLPIQVEGSSIAYDALRAHGAAYNLTGLFFGPYCGLIGWLVLRSRWLPAWIGWLMLLAGAAFLFDATVEIVAPALARQIPEAVMLISLAAEGSLAVWLAAFGVRPEVRTAWADGRLTVRRK